MKEEGFARVFLNALMASQTKKRILDRLDTDAAAWAFDHPEVVDILSAVADDIIE